MIKERFTESYQSYINQSYQIYIENTIFFEKLTVLTLKKQPPEVFCKKKCSYRNITKFTGEHLCQSLFFNKVTGLGPLEQVFSCEFCEISKKIFFTEHLWATASNISNFVVHEKQSRHILITNQLQPTKTQRYQDLRIHPTTPGSTSTSAFQMVKSGSQIHFVQKIGFAVFLVYQRVQSIFQQKKPKNKKNHGSQKPVLYLVLSTFSKTEVFLQVKF